MLESRKKEIDEASSNSDRIHYAHFHSNKLKKGMYPFLPGYGFNSRADWALYDKDNTEFEIRNQTEEGWVLSSDPALSTSARLQYVWRQNVFIWVK